MASSSKSTMHHHSPPPPLDATTTFVQAEPSTFRTIVQRLTGASHAGLLHERRETIKKLEINLNNGKKGSHSQFVEQREREGRWFHPFRRWISCGHRQTPTEPGP
ncbi:hypothetical protein GQ457_05G025690 [Hibiscus cannabinus]